MSESLGGLPFSTYAILHAIWSSPSPPFCVVVVCNTQWTCIGDWTPPPLPLGAYVLNGRPLIYYEFGIIVILLCSFEINSNEPLELVRWFNTGLSNITVQLFNNLDVLYEIMKLQFGYLNSQVMEFHISHFLYVQRGNNFFHPKYQT